MSIYRKTIDFPADFERRLREAVSTDPNRFKSAKGHIGSINALILQAVDSFLDDFFIQVNEEPQKRRPHDN